MNELPEPAEWIMTIQFVDPNDSEPQTTHAGASGQDILEALQMAHRAIPLIAKQMEKKPEYFRIIEIHLNAGSFEESKGAIWTPVEMVENFAAKTSH